MQIRSTNPSVSYLDVDIRLLPRLWLIGLPLHVAISSRRVETHPSLEFVVRAHGLGDQKW